MYRLERFVDASNKAVDLNNYTKRQNNYHDSLSGPVIIPNSANKKVSGFVDLGPILNTQKNETRVPPPNPDLIVKVNPAEDPNSELSILQKKCTSSTLDELILGANPNDRYGCGWLYNDSISRGYAGGIEGPLDLFGDKLSGKWFFDLQDAKKQILFDKCIKVGCENVNKECGYCPLTRISVPMDANGKPLYNDPWYYGCPAPLIKDPSKCKALPPPTIPPELEKKCKSVNGRLPFACLREVLLTKCSDKGSLATALSNKNTEDYVKDLQTTNAEMYNYITQQLNIFKHGKTTIDVVLGEVDNLSRKSNQTNYDGYISKDLCLESGASNSYDACSTISDSTKGPYAIKCLQAIFRKKGGNPKGTLYPNVNNIGLYNNVSSIGAIKLALDSIIKDTKSPDFYRQRTAITQMYGIKDPNVRS